MWSRQVSGLEIVQLPALTDNYNYIVRDESSGKVAVVDPSEAQPILDELRRRDWPLDFILNTHHHYDHVGGNTSLHRETGCCVVGPKYDSHRIPEMRRGLGEGDQFLLGESEAKIFYVPGHTLGHIAYFFSAAKVLFCGDVIFSLGSGFLFEGTPKQMWQSLLCLRGLPPETQIYCAHEYTLENAEFAEQFEPSNSDLRNFVVAAKERRKRNLPTVPSVMADEIACNPFLRADVPSVKRQLNMEGKPDHECLGKIRALKDEFDRK